MTGTIVECGVADSAELIFAPALSVLAPAALEVLSLVSTLLAALALRIIREYTFVIGTDTKKDNEDIIVKEIGILDTLFMFENFRLTNLKL